MIIYVFHSFLLFRLIRSLSSCAIFFICFFIIFASFSFSRCLALLRERDLGIKQLMEHCGGRQTDWMQILLCNLANLGCLNFYFGGFFDLLLRHLNVSDWRTHHGHSDVMWNQKSDRRACSALRNEPNLIITFYIFIEIVWVNIIFVLSCT